MCALHATAFTQQGWCAGLYLVRGDLGLTVSCIWGYVFCANYSFAYTIDAVLLGYVKQGVVRRGKGRETVGLGKQGRVRVGAGKGE